MIDFTFSCISFNLQYHSMVYTGVIYRGRVTCHYPILTMHLTKFDWSDEIGGEGGIQSQNSVYLHIITI